jgi:hypothetical protein
VRTVRLLGYCGLYLHHNYDDDNDHHHRYNSDIGTGNGNEKNTGPDEEMDERITAAPDTE